MRCFPWIMTHSWIVWKLWRWRIIGQIPEIAPEFDFSKIKRNSIYWCVYILENWFSTRCVRFRQYNTLVVVGITFYQWKKWQAVWSASSFRKIYAHKNSSALCTSHSNVNTSNWILFLTIIAMWEYEMCFLNYYVLRKRELEDCLWYFFFVLQCIYSCKIETQVYSINLQIVCKL